MTTFWYSKTACSRTLAIHPHVLGLSFRPCRCSFNQHIHMTLMAIWTALVTIALVELVVAQLRHTDKSPISIRIPYVAWLLMSMVLFLYVVARPLATVLDATDAAVLLTLVSLRIIAIVIVKNQINMTLIWALEGVLMHQQPHTDSARPMHITARIIFIPHFILSALTVAVFLPILPNVFGVASTPVDRLEMFLTVGWVVIAFMILFQSLGGMLFIWWIRGVIQEHVARRPLVEAVAEASPSDCNMARFDRRMSKNMARLIFMTCLHVVLFPVAAGIGMQYWYVAIRCIFPPMIGCVGCSTCTPRNVFRQS